MRCTPYKLQTIYLLAFFVLHLKFCFFFFISFSSSISQWTCSYVSVCVVCEYRSTGNILIFVRIKHSKRRKKDVQCEWSFCGHIMDWLWIDKFVSVVRFAMKYTGQCVDFHTENRSIRSNSISLSLYCLHRIRPRHMSVKLSRINFHWTQMRMKSRNKIQNRIEIEMFAN